MEFYDVIRKRRSVRSYRPDPVPEASLRRIAEAVSLAPTACNRQEIKILAVCDPALRRKVASACPQKFLTEAPVILIALAETGRAWRRPDDGECIAALDAGIVLEHAVLAAAAEGLDSCWICAYRRPDLDAALGLDSGWTALGVSPLGYGAEQPDRVGRRPLDETFEIR